MVNVVLKNFPKITTCDLANQLCDDKNCHISKDGVLLYGDRQHLTFGGENIWRLTLLRN